MNARDSKIAVSAWVYLALCLLALVGAFADLPYGPEAGLALVSVFLVLEFRRASIMQRGVGVVLTAAGVALAWVYGDVSEVVLDGVARSLIFLLLFFAVAWVQKPASESPALEAVRQFVLAQPPGRRFVMLAGGSHGLGAFLNLAGMSLLSDMVARQKKEQVRRRLAVAMMIGFTAASAWSPFYVSIAVVLIALPEVTWLDFGPLGMVTAFAIMTVTTVLDHLFARGPVARPKDVPQVNARTRRDIAVLISVLLVGVIGLREVLGVSIPVTLGLFAPPFALLWTALIHRDTRGRMDPGAALRLPRHVMGRLPDLRSEALTFVGANIFGMGVATAVDPAWAIAFFADDLWTDGLKVFGLAFAAVLGGMIGIHPVILVLLVGAVIPPDVYGLPPAVMALIMAGTWGISTTASPVSATTLFVARLTGDTPYWLAWRCGAPFALAGTVVVAAITLAVWKLGIYLPGS